MPFGRSVSAKNSAKRSEPIGVAEAALLMKTMIENEAALLYIGAIFMVGFVILTLPMGLFFGWLGNRLVGHWHESTR